MLHNREPLPHWPEAADREGVAKFEPKPANGPAVMITSGGVSRMAFRWGAISLIVFVGFLPTRESAAARLDPGEIDAIMTACGGDMPGSLRNAAKEAVLRWTRDAVAGDTSLESIEKSLSSAPEFQATAPTITAPYIACIKSMMSQFLRK